MAADSATATILYSGIAPYASVGSEQFLAHASVVALMTGGILLMARILKLGFLADFLSRTVLIGFLSGVGIQVAIAMLGSMLGIRCSTDCPILQLWNVISSLGSVHGPTLIVSIAVLVLILPARLLSPRFPAPLVAVLGTIALSALFHFGDRGIALIGPVTGGFPPCTLPMVSWVDVREMIPVAGACFLMIITQSAATSRSFGLKHDVIPDENRDLLGLAAANAVAGMSGTFVVNGSPTQTAMMESCGGRSQIANLSTAATVGVVLLILTGPLRFLPVCVLGAIVFVVALRMIDLRGLSHLHTCGGREYQVALFTALSVVLLGVQYGILLALIVSLLEHVRRGYKPRTAVIVRDPEVHWRMVPADPGVFVEPGVVLYWFGTDLYYANAPHFCDEIRRLAADADGLKAVVIDCGAITSMDFTAGRYLAELRADLASRGVILALARVTEGLRRDMDRQCLTQEFGIENLFQSRKKALTAFNSKE